jgi:hypothetical protein
VPCKHIESQVNEDYRPLTLLNTVYKLLTRIISKTRITAKRMRPWLAGILQKNQHCGLQANMVFEATAAMRDAVTCAQLNGSLLCILSIDFKEPFDKISLSYLFAVLRTFCFIESFQQRIKSMYVQPTSLMEINGHRSIPIPLRSSVRQRCPICMLMFALCLNRLLRILDENLSRIQIVRRHT